jgi:hypothetical protein
MRLLPVVVDTVFRARLDKLFVLATVGIGKSSTTTVFP